MISFLNSGDQTWRFLATGLAALCALQVLIIIRYTWRDPSHDAWRARLFLTGVFVVMCVYVYAGIEQIKTGTPVASRTYFAVVGFLFMSVAMTVSSRRAFRIPWRRE